MILVDTSVWVDHLNAPDVNMAQLLEHHQILMHPYVIGEIALGKLRDRTKFLAILSDLRMAEVASHIEVLEAITKLSLDGTGIGYVDTHLLLSAKLEGVKLWTRDRRLEAQARRLSLSYLGLQ